MRVLVFVISALLSYLLGCLNGALLFSRFVFHEDVRSHGSGNAGLTNYARTYGWKTAPWMIAVDVVKTVLAVLLGGMIFGSFCGLAILGRYWCALWVCVGHDFPFCFSFRGGKGILCAGTATIFLDWRIAAGCFGIFLLAVLLTHYISLGSILGSLSLPVSTGFVQTTQPGFLWILILSIFIAAIAVWGHRTNIRRLLHGQERKFSFHESKG